LNITFDKTDTEQLTYIIGDKCLKNITNDTALLLFSRTAVSEAVHKNFLAKKSKTLNLTISKKLITRTTAIAKQSQLPFFVISDLQQSGNNFGERLANAIQNIFDKGFQKLIVIGNDCPGLTSATILHATQKLKTHDIVAGPTIKGGLYLIGLNKAAFNPDDFKNLHWQTANVYNEFLSLEINHSFSALPLLDDVNSHQDILKQVRSSSFHWFTRFLRSALASIHSSLAAISSFFYNSTALLFTGLRAPPYHIA